MSSKAFDELLELINTKSPDDATAFRGLAEKYPTEIRDGVLRQAEFSRKMGAVDEDLKSLEKWRAWKKEYWDDEHSSTKAEHENTQTIAALQNQVDVLKGQLEAGDGMTFDELKGDIDNFLNGKGFISKQELGNYVPKRDLVDDKGNPRYVGREDLEKSFAGVEYLYSKATPLLFKHKDEFGEVIDPLEIVKFANEKGIRDITEAYNTMVTPRRQEMADKKHKEDIEAAEKRGEEKGKQTQTMGTQGRMPVDQGSPEMGHLERRLKQTPDEAKNNPIPENVQIGQGVLGRMAAEQYLKDQASKAA